jgi:c-di-GMP-binding flagellar brake protein YcgR
VFSFVAFAGPAWQKRRGHRKFAKNGAIGAGRLGGLAMAGSNKRKAIRIELALPVTYANLGKTESAPTYHYCDSDVVDISAMGLGILVDEKIKQDDLVQIVLKLPVAPYVVTGLAEAVWAEPVEGTRQYRAGLRFIQLPPELTKDLLDQLT